MVKPKSARNQVVIGLYKAGLSEKQIAEKVGLSLGGCKGLLWRLSQKGLIERGRRRIAQAPEKEKVKKEEIKKSEKVEIEKPRIPIEKVRKLEFKKVRKEEKKKVGYILPAETIKTLDLYRADHRDQSLSEIVNSAILEFLKRRK